MINEVLYCEHLMYLEWVQGEGGENEFTADGQGVHRKVNEEGKPLRKAGEPASDDGDRDKDESEPYLARSVFELGGARGVRL